MNILVADDELRLRKIVVLHLGKAGHKITEANNGKKALDLLENFKFDLAVLDVSMPELTGLEVITQMREKSIFTPVIFLSANATPEEIEMGLSKGAFKYLTKPFSLRELTVAVEEATKNETSNEAEKE